jgi:hypothetical protein
VSEERTADLRELELLFVWLLNFGSSYLPKRPEVFNAAVSDAMNLSAAISELRHRRDLENRVAEA